jgi:hypothetical protein
VAENVDLVRSIYVEWAHGDFSATEWADPEIEFALVGGPDDTRVTGLAAMQGVWRDWLSEWQDFRAEAEGIQELDGERVLVLTRNTGRGKSSGLQLGEIPTRGANVFYVRDGKVTALHAYTNRDRALAELGLDRDRGAPPA